IEHQAYLQLLAAARGASVSPVVSAGVSRTGDAILATELVGRRLDELASTELDDRLLAGLWSALFDLHGAGVSHGDLRAEVLRVDDGTVVIGSFGHAEPIARAGQVHADRAQLLVVTALLVGADRAVDVAMDALAPEAPEGVAALLGFLQTAALGPELRGAADEAGLSLDELRVAMAEAAGIEVPELQKVWRVTWGSIARLALLAFVAYVLISQLADIGWDTIVDAVASADDAILAVALAFGQVPRVATAKSLQTASPTPVPLARLARLEFAITFVNLAVPSTAARVAVNIRFFQRSGATAGGALSASALDSVFGFVAQISLLATCLLLGLGTLSLPPLASESDDRADLVPLLVGLLVLVAVAAAVVWFVPKVRAAAVHLVGQLREALTILRSPSAVARLFLYNVLAQVLFSIAIWIVLQAFDQPVAITDVIIINVAVALFAGLMPVPGGVGVTEGALTAGFVAVGVPQATALAAALCYRLITFYLPPLWGYVALRSLRRDGYL
ncbi:MAG: flippase-like domain-containing protein, partial [Acidimicrobiales bacterium]|nr:flippase-like domain-containing protein [Acidimicrobiales bacterium]